jgi:hypothetical protein
MISLGIAQDVVELVNSGFRDCIGDFFSKGTHMKDSMFRKFVIRLGFHKAQ